MLHIRSLGGQPPVVGGGAAFFFFAGAGPTGPGVGPLGGRGPLTGRGPVATFELVPGAALESPAGVPLASDEG